MSITNLPENFLKVFRDSMILNKSGDACIILLYIPTLVNESKNECSMGHYRFSPARRPSGSQFYTVSIITHKLSMSF